MKYMLRVFAVTVIVMYAISLFVYLAPGTAITKTVHRFVLPYMDSPVLRQDWHLFSPNPSVAKLRLWVSCSNSYERTPYLDPDSEYRRRHEMNIFSGVYKVNYISRFTLVNIFKGIGRILENCDSCDLQDAADKLRDEGGVKFLESKVKHYCIASLPEAQSAEAKIIIYHPKKRLESKVLEEGRANGSLDSISYLLEWGESN